MNFQSTELGQLHFLIVNDMPHRIQMHVLSELPQYVSPVLMQNEEAEWSNSVYYRRFFCGNEQSDWLRSLNRLVLDVCLYRHSSLGVPRH